MREQRGSTASDGKVLTAGEKGRQSHLRRALMQNEVRSPGQSAVHTGLAEERERP